MARLPEALLLGSGQGVALLVAALAVLMHSDMLEDGIVGLCYAARVSSRNLNRFSLVQILFVAGVAMTIGAQATVRFFLRRKNVKVTSCSGYPCTITCG